MINNAVKVGEFSSPKVVEKIIADDGIAVHAAVEALKEAQANTGIKATRNMPPEKKKSVQREQERILQAKQEQKEQRKKQREKAKSVPKPGRNKAEEAEEFNQHVLDGVFDGRRLDKNTKEIEKIIDANRRLIDLFNNSSELVHTLEQMTYLNQMLTAAIEKLKNAKQDFINAKLNRMELQTIIQKMTTAKFDPREAEKTFWGPELAALKEKYASRGADGHSDPAR